MHSFHFTMSKTPNSLRGCIQEALLGVYPVYPTITCIPVITNRWVYLRPSRHCGAFILKTILRMDALETAHAILAFFPDDTDAQAMCVFMGNVMPAVVLCAEDRFLCIRFASLLWLWLHNSKECCSIPFKVSPTCEMLSTFATNEWNSCSVIFDGSAMLNMRTFTRVKGMIEEACIVPTNDDETPDAKLQMAAVKTGGPLVAFSWTLDGSMQGAVCPITDQYVSDADLWMQEVTDAESTSQSWDDDLHTIQYPDVQMLEVRRSAHVVKSKSLPIHTTICSNAVRPDECKRGTMPARLSLLPLVRFRTNITGGRYKSRRSRTATRKERTASEVGKTPRWKIMECKEFNKYCSDNQFGRSRVSNMRKDRRRFMNMLYSRINRKNKTNFMRSKSVE